MPRNQLRSVRPSNADGLITDFEDRVRVQDLTSLDDRLGPDIKGLRKARGMTLDALAGVTGLSKGYLSQIERGLSSPSVKALHTISRALGVTISWFFAPQESNDNGMRKYVVRAGARRTLHYKSGIVDELLTPTLDRALEVLRCVFPPGAKSGSEPYAHQGEEAGFVLNGQLDMWIDGEYVRLNQGDSFAFPSDIPHRYENPGRTEAVVIWVITPPSF